MEKAIKKIENEISKAKEEQKKLDELEEKVKNRIKEITKNEDCDEKSFDENRQ